MLNNYVKIAWRNIIRNRFYSLVNIVGLSAGIAFTILIAAYIWSELQVNARLKDADNQYIIQSKWKDPSQGYELTTIGPLAKRLKESYPNLVSNYFRWDGITAAVSKADKSFREGIQICDSTMFQMYGFELLYGDPRTAFGGPFSVVLTTDKALKYFGRTDVLGQTITIENFSGSKHDFIITGILIKPYKNSVTFITDDNDNQFYISSENIQFFGRNMDWNNPYIVGYIKLRKGVHPTDLEKPMQHLLKENAPPQITNNLRPYLVSLKEYHLFANRGLIRKILYALSAIAFFILMMAIINFINMSTSRSDSRMREIGIRKVLGGLRKQLILQFLIESVILVFIATVFAVGVYMLTRDLFSQMLRDELPALSAFPVNYIAFPAVLVLLIGFTAGIYPAFVLSSLKSVESLKGKPNSIKENVLLRKSLVAFQFGTATIVLVGAIIISQQIRLFFSNDLGFNKEYLISAQLPRNWTPDGVRQMETIRSQFASMLRVANISLTYALPDGGSAGQFAFYKAGTDSTTAIPAQVFCTDEFFASTYNIPMAAGIFFSPPGAYRDQSKIVVNETQARAFGWKHAEDAIGKQVIMVPGGNAPLTITGVTKDFHFESMQQSIQPVTFLHVEHMNIYRFFSIKLKPGDISNSIAAIQKRWNTLMPGAPFEYTFMDETLSRLYKTEIQLKQASYIAAVLALIIVLLGILGLVSLSVQKRTKEIGIRKVLGSSIEGIIVLFMKEILLVILFAGTIACPVAYIIMNKWLSDYSYRIDITAIPFIISVLLLGLITSVLIIARTIKSALENPVKSLRTE